MNPSPIYEIDKWSLKKYMGSYSHWTAPPFIFFKNTRTEVFVSDFRESNERNIRKHFPIPNKEDLLIQQEGFKWGFSLDSTLWYHYITLCQISWQWFIAVLLKEI